MDKQIIKISVVEDDLFFRKSVQRYLKSICDQRNHNNVEFQIKSYAEAEDAILELEDDLDIMILDYNFGTSGGEQLTGEDVLFAVKEKCSKCEVILMSGERRVSLIERLMQKGINRFIDKNKSNINEFGSVVQQLIKRVTHIKKV